VDWEEGRPKKGFQEGTLLVSQRKKLEKKLKHKKLAVI